jgi:hypothetical protein
MTARILQFGPPPQSPAAGDEPRFEASVDNDGRIRFTIGDAHSEQSWTLSPRQVVELAAFLNHDWMARLR